MNWSKSIVIGFALVVLASAVVLAQTGKTSDGWLDAMKEHYKAVHGENWEEVVQSCHGASEGTGTTTGYGMMGAWI